MKVYVICWKYEKGVRTEGVFSILSATYLLMELVDWMVMTRGTMEISINFICFIGMHGYWSY